MGPPFQCSGADTPFPDLDTCLVGDCCLPFMRWLHNAANEMLHGNVAHVDYSAELILLTPFEVQTCSHVTLCAESARLSFSNKVLRPESDFDECEFLLQLNDISQVIGQRKMVKDQSA